MPVETAKVIDRRKLDYASLDEVLADAERLSSGPVQTLGNWSMGQIFKHLALAYTGSIDGLAMKFPWLLVLAAKVFKRKLMNMPMPAGFKLPAGAAAAVTPEPTSTEEGLTALRAAIARLQRESQRARHPMFGELSRDEWDKLHRKHANLHMSFLVPQA